MRTIRLLLPLLLCAAPARAGVTMNSESVSRYEGGTNKTSQVHYIEPEYSRLEMSVNYQDPEKKGRGTQKSVVITRLDKKVVWMLMPASKGYCEFTFDELRKAMNSGSGPVPDGAVPAGYSYKKTGGSRKIAGLDSDEYAFGGKGLNGKAWVTGAGNFRDASSFYAAQAKALGFGSAPAPGMLMAYEASSEGTEHSMIVKSVRTGGIPAEKFALPAGYKKMNASAWQDYQKNFDRKMVMDRMKQKLKEEAKERAKKAASEKGKDAVKKGLKGLVGF